MLGREGVGRPVTTNVERQEVMGTALEQFLLMKGSRVREPCSPLGDFGARQRFSLNSAVGWPCDLGKEASVSLSVKES